MDQDMIPILERDDDYGFYSPIWQHSNCHPKAPPPSPVLSTDMQCSTGNPLGPSEIWEIVPLTLPHKLSVASSGTAPGIVLDENDISDKECGRLDCPEELDVQWLPVDYNLESIRSSYRDCAPTSQTYAASPLNSCELHSRGKESTIMHDTYYGIANTTPRRTETPRSPPAPPATLTTLNPPSRGRNTSAPPASHATGTFSVFPHIPERQHEPFPELPVERSVFEHDDDEDGSKSRLRFGSISSQIRLPGKLVSEERRRKLKRRASSIVHAIMTCGLGKKP